MEEPDKILAKIMNFEKTYSPQFTDLIKQSLIENVTLEDDEHNDTYPSLPEPNTSSKSQIPFTLNNTNLSPLISTIQSSSQSNPIPNIKQIHKHRPTPIMQKPGSSNSNGIKHVDSNSFILPDDLQYESNSGSNSSHSSHSQSESEEEVHPLCTEYDEVSHSIHVLKIKLRKLDRQMTVAERRHESQSQYIKDYSDYKIKIGQLQSKRRELETHDVVRAHIKMDEVDIIEIDVRSISLHSECTQRQHKQTNKKVSEKMEVADLTDGLMEINEDEEDEDEIKNNANSSPTMEQPTSEYEPDDSYLNGSVSTTADYGFGFENYSEIVVKEDDEESDDNGLSGSIKFHSDAESDEMGGSVQYHSSLVDIISPYLL